MATDKLINQTQGADIIDALSNIATNINTITYGPQTSADKVVSMTGYAKAGTADAISQGDTLNEAIGKLEKKADDNATAVTSKIDKLTSATAGDIATVTATGEIADSTVAIETTLSDSSDAKVPTSKAVGTYVDSKGYAVGVNSSTANNLVAFNSTDGKALKDSGIAVAKYSTGLTDSDTAVPTSKTVKTYVDSTATGISRYLGTITAASGLSTSAKKGDFYVVKTAWTGVHAGDEIIAEKDNPSQTIDGTNWSLLHNEADTDTKYTFATGDSNGTFKVTPSDTGTAQSVAIKGLGNAAYTTADTSSLTNDNNHVPTSALAKSLLDAKVPTTRKVNNKALSSDITLSASDVSAVPSSNVTTTLPASSAAASTSKVMSEKLVYDNYVQNSDFVVAENNILYNLNMGVKNLLAIKPIFTNNGLTSVQQSDGYTVKITGTPTGGKSIAWSDVIKITESGTYKVKLTLNGTMASCYLYDLTTSTSVHEYYSSNTYDETLTANHEYAMYTYSTSEIDATISAMLCTATAYAQSTDYMPPALSNADLTTLEAEDRAALAEVVDSGAKNIVDLSATGSGTHNAVTFTNLGNNRYKVNGTPSATDTHLDIMGTGSTVPSFISENVGKTIVFATNQEHVYYGIIPIVGGSALEYVSGNKTTPTVYTIPSNLSGALLRIYVDTNYTYDNVTAELLACTKAAFCVSSKFVPYRPNWDLVCQVAYAGGYTGVSSPNADLNDISTSEFRVYNNPSNMPSGTSGYCWVRTNVVDINSALQEMTLLSTDSNSYVRVKAGGTWRAWKQTTNA